jgi:hypothetical protein
MTNHAGTAGARAKSPGTSAIANAVVQREHSLHDLAGLVVLGRHLNRLDVPIVLERQAEPSSCRYPPPTTLVSE